MNQYTMHVFAGYIIDNTGPLQRRKNMPAVVLQYPVSLAAASYHAAVVLIVSNGMW